MEETVIAFVKGYGAVVASGDEEPAEPLYGRFWPPKGTALDLK